MSTPTAHGPELIRLDQPIEISTAEDAFGGQGDLSAPERRRLMRGMLRGGNPKVTGLWAKLGMLAWRAIQARRQAATVEPQAELAYMVTLANNLPQRKVLKGAAAALSAIGVEAILYKGQDYLDRIYGDVGARTMADIDLLIRPRDRDRAHAALVGAGFRYVHKPGAHHEFKYCRDGVAVDLHTQLISGERMQIDIEGLFTRSQASEVVGLRALQDTDAALVHCVAQTVKGYHLPASSYFEMQWLLARANQAALVRRAIQWRACASVYASMRALAEMGNRKAAMIARRLPVGRAHRATLDRLVAWCSLHTSHATAPPRAVLLLAKFALVDRVRDALRFVSQWVIWQLAPQTVTRS